MLRSEIEELHFITPIANVHSILQHGILSHTLADKLPHASVAMPAVQERRKNKQIPRARRLHEYANLYLNARNPMLSVRRSENDSICVLRVSANVLDEPNVIVSDQNAASKWVRFQNVDLGLGSIDRHRLFSQFWTHPEDQIDAWRHKSERCAEVLVPNRVDSRFVFGAYVANQIALTRFDALESGLRAEIKSTMFF
jgi:hypothetical protein